MRHPADVRKGFRCRSTIRRAVAVLVPSIAAASVTVKIAWGVPDMLARLRGRLRQLKKGAAWLCSTLHHR